MAWSLNLAATIFQHACFNLPRKCFAPEMRLMKFAKDANCQQDNIFHPLTITNCQLACYAYLTLDCN